MPVFCNAHYSKSDKEKFENLGNEKLQFVDPSFNYDLKTIKRCVGYSRNIKWMRISEFLGNKNFEIFGEISQQKISKEMDIGPVGKAIWLLESKKGYLKRLFGNLEFQSLGGYKLSLNIGGIWTSFVIDDYIPIEVTERLKKPVFTSFDNFTKSGIWKILLEKAIAKAFGGYHKLDGLEVANIIRDLTGAPVEQFYLKKNNENFENFEQYSDESELFKYLRDRDMAF